MDGIDSLLYTGHNSIYMEEQWKDLFGQESLYSISDQGRIFCKKRAKYYVFSEKYKQRYKRACLVGINGSVFYASVHRLVAEAFISNPNNKPQVNHINGNKHDNRVENLEWCTSKENNEHSHRTGLAVIAKGNQLPQTKLTKEQVLEIRAKYIPNVYGRERLARDYNVSITAIRQVIKRTSWKHV